MKEKAQITLNGLFRDIRNTLAWQSELGEGRADCSEQSLSTASSWGRPKTRPDDGRQKQKPVQATRPGMAAPLQNAIDSLEQLRRELGDCKRCDLGNRRRNLVFGEGNPEARLVFVGEAPGFEEDMQGRPFVGPSGQLLSKMIQAMGLGREDVYICNVLKCRPTDNRNPLPEEIVTCISWLKRQIDIIRPEVICTMGGFATQALLDRPEGITKLRGCFYDYQGVRLMPVFHPAYLLRNAAQKRQAWEDLQKIMAVLGLKRSV